ncbi:hypothetical protein M413DRAFT_21135 [Hebeloma cylindrosporum]|uniref:Uncharacterized protein n=1 Tax=Hebeloma cylindrosporum TaxID=76867 RepID=A0A0C3CYA7_HEBCY|nr:hypothetical protein M413DRAFT_21135 [Hebeloma cylindrosporum h7]
MNQQLIGTSHLQHQCLTTPSPTAVQLFRDAFALPNPAPELLKWIKAHPTYAAVMDLLVHYTAVVQGNPSRANALALALVAGGIVKDANALQLLELTISRAETGFEGKSGVDNVWELLFPSQN